MPQFGRTECMSPKQYAAVLDDDLHENNALGHVGWIRSKAMRFRALSHCETWHKFTPKSNPILRIVQGK